MSEENKKLMRRWFEEVWNQGREESIDELFSATGVAHGLGETDAVVRGPDQFKPLVRNLRSSLPDLHISVEDLIHGVAPGSGSSQCTDRRPRCLPRVTNLARVPASGLRRADSRLDSWIRPGDAPEPEGPAPRRRA